MSIRASAAVRFMVRSGAFALACTGLTPRAAVAQLPVVRMAVAARALARGTVISSNDIAYRDTTVRAVGDTSHVSPGWVTRRLINVGELLREPAVEPPNVVVANQTVEIEWRGDDVALTLRGIVTRSAALGERVTVRTESGRRFDGIVVAPGRVRID